jgi:hypothetical protein
MMTMVGDPSRFAIEYALDDEHGGAWLFGRFCYWCGGSRVGDFDLGTSLRDVLSGLDGMRWAKGQRANDRFNDMPSEEVFRTLDSALFGHGNPDLGTLPEDEQWARHLVGLSVDVMDDWKVYVVADERVARILFSRNPFRDVHVVAVAPGEVDAVLEEGRLALDALYERELTAGGK